MGDHSHSRSEVRFASGISVSLPRDKTQSGVIDTRMKFCYFDNVLSFDCRAIKFIVPELDVICILFREMVP